MIQTLLILAGGASTRFWPLTSKPLFPFMGTPLIAHQVERARKYAETLVVVCAKGEKQAYELLLPTVTIVEQELRGMAGAVVAAKNYVKGETLIMNANDCIDEESFAAFINHAAHTPHEATILAREVEQYFPGGYLVVDGERLLSIAEKPGEGNEPSNLVRLAMDYFKDIGSFLSYINEQQLAQDEYFYEAALTRYAREHTVGVFSRLSRWEALKYPWHTLAVMDFFLQTVKDNRSDTSPFIHETALVEGEIRFGKNVRILNHAKVVGPTYLGDNAIIGSYSMVINSDIEHDAVVGGYSEIVRSYIGAYSTTHRNYIGDSVIGEHVLVGGGAVMANYRFDAKEIKSNVKGERVATGRQKLGAIVGNNAKLGAHTTFYPGVKVAPRCWVLPGTTVTSDLTENK